MKRRTRVSTNPLFWLDQNGTTANTGWFTIKVNIKPAKDNKKSKNKKKRRTGLKK